MIRLRIFRDRCLRPQRRENPVRQKLGCVFRKKRVQIIAQLQRFAKRHFLGKGNDQMPAFPGIIERHEHFFGIAVDGSALKKPGEIAGALKHRESVAGGRHVDDDVIEIQALVPDFSEKHELMDSRCGFGEIAHQLVLEKNPSKSRDADFHGGVFFKALARLAVEVEEPGLDLRAFRERA